MSSSADELVSWNDVRLLGESIFRVWTGGGGLAWARTAWAILGEEGLTAVGPDRDEVEELRIRGRLLTLGRFYHTFAWHAWEEGSAAAWLEWAEEDRLLWDSDLLRRLSPESHASFEESLDEDEEFPIRDFNREALDELVDTELTRVRQALETGFGSSTELFVSLWLSREPAYAGWRRFPGSLVEDVVNSVDVGDSKLPAWDWFESGELS